MKKAIRNKDIMNVYEICHEQVRERLWTLANEAWSLRNKRDHAITQRDREHFDIKYRIKLAYLEGFQECIGSQMAEEIMKPRHEYLRSRALSKRVDNDYSRWLRIKSACHE